MAPKIHDLRKPLECMYCAEGLRLNSDFLFDPYTAVSLRKLQDVTFGAFRHHTHVHVVRSRPGFLRTCQHHFLVYQLTRRGLLTIVQTQANTSLPFATGTALSLPHFPSEMDLKLNGL